MTQPTASGPRASFGVRFVAAIIDGVLLAIVNAVAGAILNATFLSFLVNVAVGLAYYSYLEGSPSGQTIGKRVMSIRVVDIETGSSIGTSRAAIRFVGRYLSAIAIGIGYLWMLWDPERQTWHDKLSASVVVPVADFPVDVWPG